MSALTYLFKSLTISNCNKLTKTLPLCSTSVRFRLKEKVTFVEKPKPGLGISYRRIIHFPEKYTVEPLPTTHLGGRDPVTGRVVVKGIGGGVKHKYHWVQFLREGPEHGPPKEEKVLEIVKCGCRDAFLALVGSGDELKYVIATVNMKPGDIIKTSKHLPKLSVLANEGDCYPVGALPIGTAVHCLQLLEDEPRTIIHSAGGFGTIKRHIGGKVVVQIPSRKSEILISPKCLACVGRVSNPEAVTAHVGSPQKMREMGNRPRSGLWHRKDGRFGRKIRPPPPLREILKEQPEKKYIRHTLPFLRL